MEGVSYSHVEGSVSPLQVDEDASWFVVCAHDMNLVFLGRSDGGTDSSVTEDILEVAVLKIHSSREPQETVL